MRHFQDEEVDDDDDDTVSVALPLPLPLALRGRGLALGRGEGALSVESLLCTVRLYLPVYLHTLLYATYTVLYATSCGS